MGCPSASSSARMLCASCTASHSPHMMWCDVAIRSSVTRSPRGPLHSRVPSFPVFHPHPLCRLQHAGHPCCPCRHALLFRCCSCSRFAFLAHSPPCGASHRSPARAAITMPTLSSSCWPPPCVLLSSVVCGITWGVWARNPDMRVNAGGELTDAALEAAANRVERRAQPTKPRKRNACDYTRNTASARDAARRTRGARRGPYARASQISHVPVSQSVSYFTVPPRAHPSTGSQSGSATPGLTQVPSTRSQGLLNCRR